MSGIRSRITATRLENQNKQFTTEAAPAERAAEAISTGPARLNVECLEDRSLMAVTISGGFSGLSITF